MPCLRSRHLYAHLLCWPVGAMYVYPHNGCLLDTEAECNRGDFAAHALGHLDSDFVHNVGALRPLGYAIHPVAALNEGARSNVQKSSGCMPICLTNGKQELRS